jgi:hypothetical protein
MFATVILSLMILSGFLQETLTLVGKKVSGTTSTIYAITAFILLFLDHPIIFEGGVIALLVLSLVSWLAQSETPKKYHRTIDFIDALISIVLLVLILLRALFYVTGR